MFLMSRGIGFYKYSVKRRVLFCIPLESLNLLRLCFFIKYKIIYEI